MQAHPSSVSFAGRCVMCSLLVAAVILSPQLMGQAPAERTTNQPAAKAPAIEKEEETLFRGFIVRGSRLQVRGSIASQAETLRAELAKLLGDDKEAELKLPFIIQLHGAAGDKEQKRSIVSKLEYVNGKYHMVLHVHLAKAPDDALLRYHLMELLLYERGLRDVKTAEEDERFLVRPWLVIGMLESIDLARLRADRRLYREGMNHLNTMPLRELFDTTELKWRGLIGKKPLAFKAVSGALVSALLRQPDGKEGMTGYLRQAANFKGEQENLLRKHFPGMNKSATSLDKWVKLELAELSTARTSESLTIIETDKRLTSLLKIRYKDAEGKAVTTELANYPAIMKLKPAERFQAVAGTRAELERLSYRSFPTYRPLIVEYEMILRSIIIGKEKDIPIKLKNLSDTRAKFLAAANRVRDYLDWYYITQSDEVGGTFKQYMELVQAMEKEKKRVNPDDAISTYLKEMEKFYMSIAK
ncbi:MAG: hypothetical protein ACPG32_14550 [Akkermansiaceae bacterium]